MESGIQLGLGEGPIKNVPTLQVPSVPRYACMLAHTCKLGVLSVTNFTLGS